MPARRRFRRATDLALEYMSDRTLNFLAFHNSAPRVTPETERTLFVDDLLTRFLENLGGRVHGPMNFRMILQPPMAVLSPSGTEKGAHVKGRCLVSGTCSTAGNGHDLVVALILDAVEGRS